MKLHESFNQGTFENDIAIIEVGYFIYAYELMLGLHVFRQTGLPRPVDCLDPLPICYIKIEASR